MRAPPRAAGPARQRRRMQRPGRVSPGTRIPQGGFVVAWWSTHLLADTPRLSGVAVVTEEPERLRAGPCVPCCTPGSSSPSPVVRASLQSALGFDAQAKKLKQLPICGGILCLLRSTTYALSGATLMQGRDFPYLLHSSLFSGWGGWLGRLSPAATPVCCRHCYCCGR